MVFVLKCPCLNCTLHLSTAPAAVENNEEAEWVKGNFKGKKIGVASLALAGSVTEEEKLVHSYTLSKDWKMWKIHHCTNCRTDLFTYQTSNPTLVFVNTEDLKNEEQYLQLQNSPAFSSVFRIILDGEVGKDISIETPGVGETEKLAVFSRLQKKLEGIIRAEADAMDKRIKDYEEEQKKQFQKFQISLLGQRKLLWQKIHEASQPVRTQLSSSSSSLPTLPQVSLESQPASRSGTATKGTLTTQKPRSPSPSPRNSYRLSASITSNSSSVSNTTTTPVTATFTNNTATSGPFPSSAVSQTLSSINGVRLTDSSGNLPLIEITSTSVTAVTGTSVQLSLAAEKKLAAAASKAAAEPSDKKVTYDEPAIFSFEEESAAQRDATSDPDDKDEEMKEPSEERERERPSSSRKHIDSIYSSSVPINIPLNKYPLLDDSLAQTLKPHELASTLYTPNPYNSLFDVPLSSTKRIKSII